MTFLISTKGISLINLLLVFYSMFPIQCISLFLVAIPFIFIKPLVAESASIFLKVCFVLFVCLKREFFGFPMKETGASP